MKIMNKRARKPKPSRLPNHLHPSKVSYGLPVPGLPMATREQVLKRIAAEVDNLRHDVAEARKLRAEADAAAARVSSTQSSILAFAQLLVTGPFGDEEPKSRKSKR